MRHREKTNCFSALALLAVLFCAAASESRGDGQVLGIVRMPDVCSPSVSPAVVYLVPEDAKDRQPFSKRACAGGPAGQSNPAEVVLVNQRGLQFVPRVRAIAPGQTVRFTNDDGETHNVHVVSPGFSFNQSMSPGQFHDFTPMQAGVMKLACDIHMHMRAFVVVSPTPWVRVCDRDGRYRLDDVPNGRFTLIAWHEMGDPVRRQVTVSGGQALELPELVLASSLGPSDVAGQGRSTEKTATVRPWADVIDRIGVAFAASRDAAMRPGERASASAGR